RLWKIVAGQSVLAAGGIERPIVFGGNDRPGVMLASAIRTYANRFAVAAGRRLAVFTASDDGWTTAFDLVDVGVDVVAIVDARTEIDGGLTLKSRQRRLSIYPGSHVVDTRGCRQLRQMTVRGGDGRLIRIEVDALAVSGGWKANLSLSTHLGNRPVWSDQLATFVPGELPPGMTVVGAARGSFSLADALHQGAAAGVTATKNAGHRVVELQMLRADDDFTNVTPLWHVADS